jgi:DNA-binding transcriptional ArsR family regulator
MFSALQGLWCPVGWSFAEALSRFGYALSDATRTRILLSLREGPGYPSGLAESIGVSRQILSNHLACLRGCGLVVAVPEGRRSRYELADRRIGHAIDDLLALVVAVDPACARPPPTATAADYPPNPTGGEGLWTRSPAWCGRCTSGR